MGDATGSGQAPGIEVGFAQNGQSQAFGTVRDGKAGGPIPQYGIAMARFVDYLSKQLKGKAPAAPTGSVGPTGSTAAPTGSTGALGANTPSLWGQQ